MKKFHDVKRREIESSPIENTKTNHEDGDFSFFWSDHKAEKSVKPKASKIKKANNAFLQKAVFLTAIILFFLAFSVARVMDTKDKMEVLTKNASVSLEKALVLMSQGDMEAATVQAEKASEEIRKTKLNAQSIGQDFGYLSMISDKSSKIVDTERLLNATNTLLEGVLAIRKQFGGNLKDNVAHAADNDVFSFDVEKNAELFRNIYKQVKEKIDSSELLLSKINVDKFSSQRSSIERAKSVVATLKLSLADLDQLLNKDLVWLSGSDGTPKKILLVFQNNAELRGGSGGSFGSFGIMNFNDGKLEKIDFGKNIFKIDADFRAKTTIAPPEELFSLVGGQWVMKDSGWAVDGNEAMQNMKFFYEQETGDSVQGVMVIDTTAFEQILKLIGPVEMPAYSKTITADNFRTETEMEVHKDYFAKAGAAAENEPKKIIGDMMPIVAERLFGSFQNEKSAMEFLNLGSSMLKNKHIMINVDNQEFESRLNRYNYSGKIYSNNYEYLNINNSNVNGFKSSLSVNSNILLESALSSDGTVTDKLTYTRSHNGTDVWPDGVNNNFVRVLLPKGSQVSGYSALEGNFKTWDNKTYNGDGSGYSLIKEAERDEVKFWMNTKPKENSKIELNYTFKTDALSKQNIVYPILFQKQPGVLYDEITYRLTLPYGYIPEGDYLFDQRTRVIEQKIKLESDKLIVLKLKKV